MREIAAPQERVYAMLSDLRHLEGVSGRLPADKAAGLTFDRDTVGVSVAPVGKVSMRIVGREEPKCVKFETVESPVPFNFWIQLLPTAAGACKMRLTIKADLNPFIKGMVQKPLQEGLEKIADALQSLSY